MKNVAKSFGVLSLALLLMCFGGVVLHAEVSEAPSGAPADPSAAEAGGLDPGCGRSIDAPLLDLQPPTATPAGTPSSFYVCLTTNDLCGGSCPSGTWCATEACGSVWDACCTLQTKCVSSCTFTTCQNLCRPGCDLT